MTTHTRADVERRLRTTFHARADRLVVRDLDRDRELRAELSADPDVAIPIVDLDLKPRRRWTALAVAALVLVVVIVGGAVTRAAWLTGDSSDRSDVRTRPTETPSTVPPAIRGDAPTGSLLAPSVVPDGLQLWSMSSAPSANTAPASAHTAMASTQLFGAVDEAGALAPGLLIETQPVQPGSEVRPGGPVNATVRGHDVTVDAAKDAGEETQEFAWVDGNVEVRVTIRGTTVAKAVAILDALQPRAAGMLAGFDPASAPAGITQLGESTNQSTKGVDTAFAYGHEAPDVDASPELAVWTMSGAPYPGYLRTWMAGQRMSDGVAIHYDPFVGAYAAWPDGRQAVASSKSLGRATLERVARSMTRLGPTNAQQLAADLSTRLAALPVLATKEFAAGRLELRGTGVPSAICLRVQGAEPVCGSASQRAYDAGPTGTLAGSALVDGTWLVFATARTRPLIQSSQMIGSTSSAAVTPETGSEGEWQLALAAIPDGVDRVDVFSSDGAGDRAFVRPAPDG